MVFPFTGDIEPNVFEAPEVIEGLVDASNKLCYRIISGSLLSPISHVLHLYTAMATLAIDPEPSEFKPTTSLLPQGLRVIKEGCVFYSVRVRTTGKKIAPIVLNRERRDAYPSQMDFVCVANDGYTPFGPLVYVMLIEWKQGIAYRVQLCAEPLKAEDWEEVHPQRRWIALA